MTATQQTFMEFINSAFRNALKEFADIALQNAAKEKEAARKKFTPVETFTTPPRGSPGPNHRQHCRRQPGGWRHHPAGHPAIP